MQHVVLGAAIAVISAILAMIERRLDDLIDPVDVKGEPLSDLDAMVERNISWVLLPMAGRVPPSGVFSTADKELIRGSYNYNVEQVQAARFSKQEFDRAKRNLHRFFTGAILAGVPVGVIIALQSPEALLFHPGLWLTIVAFGALMSATGCAYSLMRRARSQYAGVTIGLRERLGERATSLARSSSAVSPEEGQDDG